MMFKGLIMKVDLNRAVRAVDAGCALTGCELLGAYGGIRHALRHQGALDGPSCLLAWRGDPAKQASKQVTQSATVCPTFCAGRSTF